MSELRQRNASSAARPTRVLFVPDYSQHNPYQRLLADGLAAHGVHVSYAGAARGCPLPLLHAWLARGCPQVLHVHWTHEFFDVREGDANPRAVARFFAQISLLRRMGARIVWTVHNLAAHDGQNGPLELAAHRKLASVSDAIFCHCAAARDAAIEAFSSGPEDHGRFHVVPHGSYIGEYADDVSSAEARRRLGLSAEARVFLFVGAIRAYKGVQELVSAFCNLREPSAQLLIAGRPRTPQIEQSLREAVAHDTRISLHLGFVPPDDLQLFLRACDAVVLPFRNILTSGSAILALGFGRPVIAPRIGCLPETVPPDAGLLYDCASPNGLDEALREACSADLPEMQRSALARARASEFDWKAIAARAAELYRG